MPNGDLRDVVLYCDNVLLEYPKNTRAAHCKTVALYNLKNYDTASRELLDALDLTKPSGRM